MGFIPLFLMVTFTGLIPTGLPSVGLSMLNNATLLESLEEPTK
ncbi:MAG: hypothetical protein BWY27_00017 [Bacteroidetes bacterium ADurb.Bin234]|nr:MAG: hypothetical protein BWY27_00017 [Bacteroidetes bacterium ADurb.Bin234]